jgi:hypothetical protein
MYSIYLSIIIHYNAVENPTVPSYYLNTSRGFVINKYKMAKIDP